MTNTKRNIQAFSFIFITSFLINHVWEVAHSPLYDWNSLLLQNDVYFYVPRIFLSTFGDGLLVLLLFIFMFWFQGRDVSSRCLVRKDYVVFAILAIITAVIIEVRARALVLWSYLPSMPTLFGWIGLSPLVQLAITGVLTLKLHSMFLCDNSRT